jgi:hypothetical protein
MPPYANEALVKVSCAVIQARSKSMTKFSSFIFMNKLALQWEKSGASL